MSAVDEHFESLLPFATRPPCNGFLTDTAEFYRWYAYGGQPRDEPLTREQLVAYLERERGYGPKEAQEAGKVAPSENEWNWFKQQFLARNGTPLWDSEKTVLLTPCRVISIRTGVAHNRSRSGIAGP